MFTWIKGLLTTPALTAEKGSHSFGGESSKDLDVQPDPIWVPEPRTHVVRRADQSLARLGIGSPSIRRRLSLLGMNTVGDLASCQVARLRKDGSLGSGGARWLKPVRQACVLYLKLRSLRMVDARLLVGVHRTRVRSIGAESPVRLHRDLQRFIVSTRGQQVLGRKSPPTRADVEAWVAACNAALHQPTK